MISLKKLFDIVKPYGLIKTESKALKSDYISFFENKADIEYGNYLFFFDKNLKCIIMKNKIYDDIESFKFDLADEYKNRKNRQIDERIADINKDFTNDKV